MGITAMIRKTKRIKRRYRKTMEKVGQHGFERAEVVVKNREICDLAQQSAFLSLQQLFSLLHKRVNNKMRREKHMRRSRRKYEIWKEPHRSHIIRKATVALKGGGRKQPRKALPWMIMKWCQATYKQSQEKAIFFLCLTPFPFASSPNPEWP